MSNWIEWENGAGQPLDLIKSIDTATTANNADTIDWALTPQAPDLMKSLVMTDAVNRAPADYLEKAILTTEQRKDTDKMHYLLPEKHMFPTPDATHAKLAEELADRALHAGHITAEEAAEVKSKAKARLKELGGE